VKGSASDRSSSGGPPACAPGTMHVRMQTRQRRFGVVWWRSSAGSLRCHLRLLGCCAGGCGGAPCRAASARSAGQQPKHIWWRRLILPTVHPPYHCLSIAEALPLQCCTGHHVLAYSSQLGSPCLKQSPSRCKSGSSNIGQNWRHDSARLLAHLAGNCCFYAHCV
jgi:hypothetical protein